jgi:hypothetical protein
MSKRYLRVKNLETYQHYKDRDPKWIKVYTSLLEDYDFTHLPDGAKWHLIGIWILAARMKNRIPDDAKWVAKQIEGN